VAAAAVGAGEKGPSVIVPGGRFQAPFVPHFAAVGANFCSLSESAGASDCDVRGPRAADVVIISATGRLCAESQRKV